MAVMVSGLGGPAGYGENVFSSTGKYTGNNDDGAVQVDITSVFGAGGIDFFGTSYTSIFVNSNGNISFGTPNTDYQSSNLAAETDPIIAAFWADVDITSGGEIYWDLDPAAGTFTITWDGVAPYSGSGNNSFQLVLTSTGSGDFTVDYIYEDIQWTDGGGFNAQTGLTDGGSNDFLLDGSGNATTLADYETHDFGTGDPSGTTDFTFVDGEPVFSDGVVSGTAGSDVIDASYTDVDGEVVDGGDGTGAAGNEDLIHGHAGDDTIAAGDEADTVFGDAGADSIDGGGGDDTIYGDFGGTGPTSATEFLDWSAQGADATDLSAGFTQTTGEMEVTVSFTSDGDNLPEYTVETTDTVYVDSGEPFDPNSNVLLFGDGDGATSTTTIDFAATAGSGFTDEVQNVSFRINDIDWGAANHTDIVTINAFDADGNPVSISITVGAGDTVTGNTITAEEIAENFDDLGGSALIEIAGPISSIEISYSNGQTGTQGIWVTDVHFDTIVAPDLEGDDVITGGTGADVIYGEDGDDTITVAQGDTASGGDGDDTFLVTDLGETGSAAITLTGGETGETAGDTLDFQGTIGFGDITFTTAESGYATLADGSVLTFSEIENIIVCFTQDTPILTPRGERMIQDLRCGDLVLTRDHGPQPVRWIGNRTVLGHGRQAPIRFAPGAMGNTRAIQVSPQHRMLHIDAECTLYFGSSEVMVPAKHLVNGSTITQTDVERVTYYHMMFDSHEVVYAAGAPSESFHPGREGLQALSTASREDLFTQFPKLRSDQGAYGDTARTVLRRYEVKLLNIAPPPLAPVGQAA